MRFKDIFRHPAFYVGIGLLVGSGLTRNKYVFGVFVVYAIILVLFNVILPKLKTAKETGFKSLKAETVANFVDYNESGHKLGQVLFARSYKKYVFLFNVLLAGVTAYFFYRTGVTEGANQLLYLERAFIYLLFLNIYIFLNQLWRTQKHTVVILDGLCDDVQKLHAQIGNTKNTRRRL